MKPTALRSAATPGLVKKTKERQQPIGYVFIAPGFLVYFIFMFLPVFIGLFYSFTSYNFTKNWGLVGFYNYTRLLEDPLFLKAIYNTFIYALFTIIPNLVLGLLLATALNGPIRGRIAFRTSIFLPYVTSMVAVSMVWLWIYEPSRGILNQALLALGQDRIEWLTDPKYAMGSIIVMSLWKGIGFNMVVFLAGLQGIPASLYEAATVDGASRFRQLLSITIPMLRPTTFFLFVINCINSFMVFEQVMIMTGGGPLDSTTTIVHQIYTTAFQKYQMGYAMSMAMVLFLITSFITIANFKYGNQGQDLDID